ncbi:MAG: hypothetical protein KDB03_11805 [Planctomycetales bacterium]|nr:hypothetical protein [Planctomycetales bacterium]
MHTLFHTICAIVIVPYVALATFFVFITQASQSKGLKELIDVVWNNTDWFVGLGIYATPVLWVCLVAMGFVPSFQKAGSLCLCLLAILCLLIIVTLQSTRLDLGQAIFLLPCGIVAIVSGWLFYHANSAQ